MVSAPGLGGASRSRGVSRRVVRSAPGRISLDKESILRMTRTEARSVLRATTPMTFFRMGRQRGLMLFALLLIMATQPTQAFLNHAVAVGHGKAPNSAPVKARRWYEAFKGREVGVATQLSRSATATAVAYSTGSGTATTALIASQVASEPWGQFILSLVVVTFLVKQILDYGKARMQASIINKQLAAQTRMVELLIESQARPRRRGVRTPSANRLALPAIMAAS
jgi:hypothetical protein